MTGGWDDDSVDAEFASIASALAAPDTSKRVFSADGDDVIVDIPVGLRELLAAMFDALTARIRDGVEATGHNDAGHEGDEATLFALAVDEGRFEALAVDVSDTRIDRATAWRWLQALNDIRMWLAAAAGADLGPHRRAAVPVHDEDLMMVVGILSAMLSELVEALDSAR